MSSGLDSLELTRRVVDRLEADGLTWGQLMLGEKMNLHPIVLAVTQELDAAGFVKIEKVTDE